MSVAVMMRVTARGIGRACAHAVADRAAAGAADDTRGTLGDPSGRQGPPDQGDRRGAGLLLAPGERGVRRWGEALIWDEALIDADTARIPRVPRWASTRT